MSSQNGMAAPPSAGFPFPGDAPAPGSRRLGHETPSTPEELKRIRDLNVQRQKEMAADTLKLLALASQLKSETNTPAQETPVAKAMRQAEEIEKLAHGVRAKMTEDFSPN